jgi:hypothetical protein
MDELPATYRNPLAIQLPTSIAENGIMSSDVKWTSIFQGFSDVRPIISGFSSDPPIVCKRLAILIACTSPNIPSNPANDHKLPMALYVKFRAIQPMTPYGRIQKHIPVLGASLGVF